MKDHQPDVEIFEHCECSDLKPARLIDLLRLALPLCIDKPGTETPVLPGLNLVELNIVSDEAIAKVHGEFMNNPTPTDVITFHHGEILVSADTARSTAPEHGLSPWQETLLYMIHGLLHLNGHIDQNDPERAEMHRIQDEILAKTLS